MPNGDRKGPEGKGPMTGRRAGFCSGAGEPGYTNGGGAGADRRFSGRRGAGLGRGAGSGYGRGYGAFASSETPADEQNTENAVTEQELTVLKDRLRELEQRLSEKNRKA